MQHSLGLILLVHFKTNRPCGYCLIAHQACFISSAPDRMTFLASNAPGNSLQKGCPA
jgi:hypothetical protein